MKIEDIHKLNRFKFIHTIACPCRATVGAGKGGSMQSMDKSMDLRCFYFFFQIKPSFQLQKCVVQNVTVCDSVEFFQSPP